MRGGVRRAAAAALLSGGCASPPLPGAEAPETVEVAAVLDELHAAASRADGERYFALFAPGGVFLGTDASERWELPEFRAYASARFERGEGWTYRVTGRRVYLDAHRRTAWFDESLHNAKYGTCRGTGVLVRGSGGPWRIAQYHLTIPVPNELAADVVKMIGDLEGPAPGSGR